MKSFLKRALLVLVAAVTFAAVPFTVFAGEFDPTVPADGYVTYLDDGSYYVTVIEDCPDVGDPVNTAGSRSTVTKSKSTTYYNSSNTAQWKFTLKGTITYDGSTSQCTGASSSVTIYNTAWSVYSKTASHSGNQATGNVTMQRKVLGIVVETKTRSLTLTCDKNGNVS